MWGWAGLLIAWALNFRNAHTLGALQGSFAGSFIGFSISLMLEVFIYTSK
jgi:hypothetical protein